MNAIQRLSRRDLIRSTITVGVGIAVPSLAFAGQSTESPTQAEGPFYMNTWDRTRPVPHHNDLTWGGKRDIHSS